MPSRAGVCLIDVRPLDRVRAKDVESFAAAFGMALACGWEYVVAAGWRRHVFTGLDVLSCQRRPLPDPLGLRADLLERARSRVTFGELVAASTVPALAPAELLHQLWHRSLGIDLSVPLSRDATIDTEALLDQVEVGMSLPGFQKLHVPDMPKPPAPTAGVIGSLRAPSREL